MTDRTLRKLCEDRELVTNEIHRPNHFYGHDVVLKRYCRIDQNYPLKAVIEHGVCLDNPVTVVWDKEKNAPLPMILCANKAHADYLTKTTDKIGVPIGPMLMYALPFAGNVEKERKKKLLIIPTHSTHYKVSHYDENEFFAKVDEYGLPPEQISVLLYWRDVLLGYSKKYTDRGYKVCTAGHMFDKKFLYLLAEILQNHDYILTDSAGTHVLYGVTLKKPVWISQIDIAHYREERGEVCEYSNFKYPPERKLEKLFSKFTTELTQEQYEHVYNLIGGAYTKSPEKLLEVLMFAEKKYTGA